MTTDLFGAADDATPLDDDERQQLIPSITTRAELNQVERININAARIWAMRRSVLRRADLLTDTFVRELHRRMFNHVWRWAGRYRTSEKNLGWEVHRITEGVRNAVDDAQAWLEHSTYPLPEAAVRLHHRLVLIHPWSNGNGRHARLMSDILMASRGGEALTWGAGSDLVALTETRRRYIEAVRAADTGEFSLLLAFARS
ncbi:MAG TPA: mobile mystery protein B [Opitutaceae bacterium]|nr:mobile mystery protein B [Opitutaceae bacterium]